jgi:hypothetical protein
MVSWKWAWLWVSLFAAVSSWVVVRKSRDEAPAPAPARAPVAHARIDAKPDRDGSSVISLPSLRTEGATATAPYALEYLRILYVKQAVEPAPPSILPDTRNVVIGDVTGDGRNDLVAVTYFLSSKHPAEVLVYQLVGDTGYVGPARYPTPDNFQFGVDSVLGDFNEDGTQDLVLSGDEVFATYLSKPGGGFTIAQRPIFEGRDIGSMVPPVVLDANRDGHLDLVFYMEENIYASQKPWTPTMLTQLVTLLGNGRGEFPSRQTFVTFGSEQWHTEMVKDMTTGDVDGDGWIDIVARVVQYGTTEAQVPLVRFYRNAGKKLVPWMSVNPIMGVGDAFSSMDYLALGDVNRDGRTDLVGSANDIENHEPHAGHAWVIYQSPRGKFDTKPYMRTIAPLAMAVTVVDLDRDGNGDVVASGDSWPRLSINMGIQGAVFGDGQMFTLDSNDGRTFLNGIATGDLTGDGCPDVATAKGYYGVHVFVGRNCGKHVRPPKAMR